MDDHVPIQHAEDVRQHAEQQDPGGEGGHAGPQRRARHRLGGRRRGAQIRASGRPAQTTAIKARAAVGQQHALGVAPPSQQQPHAQDRKRHAIDQLHDRRQPDVAQGGEQFGEEIEGDDGHQRRGRHGDHVRPARAAENQQGEPSPRRQDARDGRQPQDAARQRGPPQEGVELAPLAIVFQVAAERAGNRQHRQRRGQHQETEGHVPQAQLFRVEPAAEQHRAEEPDQPLHHAQGQQDQHAVGQRVGAGRRRRHGTFGIVEGEGHDEGLGIRD